ncbi:MAG: hypothetical protein APF77_01510 [Clostridia bacterium BRH_c25]|nr:MAG: hypothetical protein APF77_01510 [Clostridia bacterium BRH_c25]
MLTIDEYIAKMKRADKIDEFDYSKKPENMSAVMKYVMTYFNEYLNIETCDTEMIKFKHATDKLEEEAEKRYPKSKEFIINFYILNKIRISKELEKWVEGVDYFPFYYSDDDFSSLAVEFCADYKLKGVDMKEFSENVGTLIAEIKKDITDEPSPSDMIHLDSNIVSWVRETYRKYGVDLYSFAADLASKYYERHVKYEREMFGERVYHVNNYNHRYNKNPFGIDQIYEDNKHRPFLENRRGELEMLVMHEWLFSNVYDDEYWPEYVNLCICNGRVSIARNVNALIPVTVVGLKYPDDAPCSTELIISTDGILKRTPEGDYIFRMDVSQSYSDAWQSTEKMEALISVLNSSFKTHGAPKVLEFTAPIKTEDFDDEAFLLCCSLIEKKMKKYAPVKLAIVNGGENRKLKQISYLYTIEDIIKLKTQLRERKIHILFSIDFSALSHSKRSYSHNEKEIFGSLTEMKNSIICLNINNERTQAAFGPKSKTRSDDTEAYYLNKYKYPRYDDFYSMLSLTLNDNQRRYLIPKNINSDMELEGLVDNLLRSGFAFCDGGAQHE